LHANACEECLPAFRARRLVLKAYAGDFSTAEKNSDLIVFDEIFAPRQRRNNNKNEKKNNNREISRQIRFG